MNKTIFILGSSYFDTISILIERIEGCKTASEKPSGVGNKENGYAASICLLGIVCLESYVMRTRYIHGATGDRLNRHSVPKFLRDTYATYPYYEETNELFVVRDLLAHNHLVEESYVYDKNMIKKNHGSVRVSSGDKKFAANVSSDLTKTKKLNLNTIPIGVGFSDAMLVLQMMWKILLFLEKKNRSQCYVSHLSVLHKGKYIKMGELIGMPETCT